MSCIRVGELQSRTYLKILKHFKHKKEALRPYSQILTHDIVNIGSLSLRSGLNRLGFTVDSLDLSERSAGQAMMSEPLFG